MGKKLFGGIKIFKTKIFKDYRGSFKEVYKKKLVKDKNFIFNCLSVSKKKCFERNSYSNKKPTG